MIVARTDRRYRFITQPAHARLAGALARHWGRDSFERPEPRGAVLAATDLHDEGWAAFDRQPRLGVDSTPLGFTGVGPEPWIEIYERGIEAVTAIDPYSGLLVSMHGTGLRRRRYGLSPSWPETKPAFEQFVSEQEADQRSLAERLHAEGDGRISTMDLEILWTLHQDGQLEGHTESRLWQNYGLLQAWDSLSLAFCTSVSGPSSGQRISAPQEPGLVGTSLELDRLGDGSFVIEPYPFGTEPLEVSVPYRTVAASAFDTESELFDAYYDAEMERLTVILTTGEWGLSSR